MSINASSIPERICDLVMKGGVTSGVIYPSAVCELAREYSFKNIGGTSAGAIAAAAAAAAECGRRNGAPAGFTELARLPEWLGKGGRLLNMFRPDPSTRALMSLLLALTSGKSGPAAVGSVTWRLLRNFPLTASLIIALVLAARWWLLADISGAPYIYAFAATIVLGLLLFLLAVVLFLYRQFTRILPANFYGMSRAYNPKAKADTAEAPLTNWLSRYLNELAGKPLAAPLTFGHLYRAQRAPGDPEPDGPDYRAINLEMMTTALNHGRPYRLPFRDPDRVFYFSEEDFSRLFPRSVVDHMKEVAPDSEGPAPHAPGCARLYRFPEPDDLPVVVATRMSLSFPVLLSAVPLYAVDFTLEENADKTKSRRAERCWFSDGGISSNLPIHFFDSALPLWPTFAINLKQFHPDHTKEEDAVWYPPRPNSGWLPQWTRFEQPGRFGTVSAFLGAVLNAMQNWQDNTQARVPAYRDRLVHVSQKDDEGGLNLSMDDETVKRLAIRGVRAGQLLLQRFRSGDGWVEHRWVRFRSCMELTEDWIRQLARAYPAGIPPDAPLEEILLRPAGAPPAVYRLSAADKLRAKRAMDELIQMAGHWAADETGFQSDPPRPLAELRIRARI
jgi:predicted acylesterase/phospholipase RssA